MMAIDIFINQLIQLGLAESFLEVINNHYIKVTELYNLISVIDTNNVRDMECYLNKEDDSITLIIHLYNPIEDIISNNTEELTIQVINKKNSIELTVLNNYDNEEDIYETRLNGYAKSNYRKWS